jgi:hypothetical protein
MLEGTLAGLRNPGSPRLRFRVIANADFSSEILEPVLEQIGVVADSSELFVRAQQLMQVCRTARQASAAGGRGDRTIGATGEDGSGIGEHVRVSMAALAASGRLTDPIVRNLLDQRFCKAAFNLGLPFLKQVDRAVPLSRQRIDRNGYARYWKHPLRIGDQEFLMCSQWFAWQRDAFDAWRRKVAGDAAYPTHGDRPQKSLLSPAAPRFGM